MEPDLSHRCWHGTTLSQRGWCQIARPLQRGRLRRRSKLHLKLPDAIQSFAQKLIVGCFGSTQPESIYFLAADTMLIHTCRHCLYSFNRYKSKPETVQVIECPWDAMDVRWRLALKHFEAHQTYDQIQVVQKDFTVSGLVTSILKLDMPIICGWGSAKSWLRRSSPLPLQALFGDTARWSSPGLVAKFHMTSTQHNQCTIRILVDISSTLVEFQPWCPCKHKSLTRLKPTYTYK